MGNRVSTVKNLYTAPYAQPESLHVRQCNNTQYISSLILFPLFFQDQGPYRVEGPVYMPGWASVCVCGSPSLLFFWWRCKDRAPSGIVPKSPWKPPTPPPHPNPSSSSLLPPTFPPSPLYGRKKEMKFFNYEPITVNKKNMHYSRSHWVIASNTRPHQPTPPTPSTLDSILRSSHCHYLFLFLTLSHPVCIFLCLPECLADLSDLVLPSSPCYLLIITTRLMLIESVY